MVKKEDFSKRSRVENRGSGKMVHEIRAKTGEKMGFRARKVRPKYPPLTA